jgi:hypothetical protein
VSHLDESSEEPSRIPVVAFTRRHPVRRSAAILLVERVKTVQVSIAEQYEGWPFVAEWDALLEMPPAELRAKLISRDREMVRLRNSSPFFLTEGVDFGDYDRRIRIARAARRVAQRLIMAEARRASGNFGASAKSSKSSWYGVSI